MPLIALVAAVAVVAGIAFGYGIAPKPRPLPSSSQTMAGLSLVEPTTPWGSAIPSFPAVGPAPTGFEVPPPGGLTLSQAVSALNDSGTPLRKFGTNLPELAVVYARVERYADLPSPVNSPEAWVWAIAVSSSLLSSPPCGQPNTPQPCPSPAATTMFILNYNTGAYLQDWSPAFP
ncbi:MAG TPA: hypothetical protein VF337_05500 [Candidatus Limnocylindrales bacterium]